MVRPNNEDRLYQAHADVCKVFANPWRLRIVEALGDSELTAGQLTLAVGIPKSNLSQHLATMRDKGIVESRREGARIYYRLTSPKILAACRLMREVLLDSISRASELVRANQL